MPQLAITGARLVDARSDDPIGGDVLLVDGDGRIAGVGLPVSAVPDGALVIDAAGMTLVPGLIDCHVHLMAAHERIETGSSVPTASSSRGVSGRAGGSSSWASRRSATRAARRRGSSASSPAATSRAPASR